MSDTNDMPEDFVSWVVSGSSNIPAGTRWDGRIVQSHLLAWQAATERATAIERERCAKVCENESMANGFVEDCTCDETDICYNMPICHSIKAIRQGGAG